MGHHTERVVGERVAWAKIVHNGAALLNRGYLVFSRAPEPGCGKTLRQAIITEVESVSVQEETLVALRKLVDCGHK